MSPLSRIFRIGNSLPCAYQWLLDLNGCMI
jgi:hypothetical protein